MELRNQHEIHPRFFHNPYHGNRMTEKSESFGVDREGSTARTETPASSPVRPSPGIAYDYPLRSNFLANLLLPRDLTALEAEKLKAFVGTLPLPEQATR